MDAGPELRRFEVGVHAGKDHAHDAALLFGFGNPNHPSAAIMLIVASAPSQAEPDAVFFDAAAIHGGRRPYAIRLESSSPAADGGARPEPPARSAPLANGDPGKRGGPSRLWRRPRRDFALADGLPVGQHGERTAYSMRGTPPPAQAGAPMSPSFQERDPAMNSPKLPAPHPIRRLRRPWPIALGLFVAAFVAAGAVRAQPVPPSQPSANATAPAPGRRPRRSAFRTSSKGKAARTSPPARTRSPN